MNITPTIAVSIIIPVYNTEKYLETCVSSIILNFPINVILEIIIVDDCSPGNCDQIVDRIKNKLVMLEWVIIHYIKHEINKSLFQARKTGFLKAKGTYVMTIDSDDQLFDMQWEHIFSILRLDHPEVLSFGIYCGDCIESAILDSNHCNSFNEKLKSTDLFERFIAEGHWPLVAKLFRHDLINVVVDNFDLSNVYINISEDFLYMSCIMLRAQSYEYSLNIGKYFYRINGQSITSTNWFSSEAKALFYLKQYKNSYDCTQSFYKKHEATENQIVMIKEIWSTNIQWLVPPLVHNRLLTKEIRNELDAIFEGNQEKVAKFIELSKKSRYTRFSNKLCRLFRKLTQ